MNKILQIINKFLIPILVEYKCLRLLSILMIINLRIVKEIYPKKKVKYRAIILYKSVGINDLIESQKLYNNDILYLACPRYFFKCIFMAIFKKKNHVLNDLNYNSDDKDIENFKIKYKQFLVLFLKTLKEHYNFHLFIGFNFRYLAEIELHSACSILKISFLILFKESILTEIQRNYLTYEQKMNDVKFNGYKIAVYSNLAKKFLIDSGVVGGKKIDITGCARIQKCFSYKNIIPKNQILYYAIENNRGLPNKYINVHGNKFFRNLKYHTLFNPKFNWKKLHLKTLKILKIFAIKNSDIKIIIKIKTGEDYKLSEYKNLPRNMIIKKFGAGHEFLRNSKIVIGWNTTSILEGIAANRFVLIPYFYRKSRLFKLSELKLNLKNKNYGYSENNFSKKLNFFLKKNYESKKNYNKQSSLKYYLGNHDNKAGFRLNKFIKENIFFKEIN